MMSLYRTITGEEPGTSVGGPGQTNEGIAAGKHGRAISGRKWAGLITGSKGGVVCALA